MPAVMYILCSKLNAVNNSLFTALSLQTYFDRHCLYCNYFFLPLYSSDTVNLARPFARRAAKTRRPFLVAILSRKPCLFFLFLLEGWNVLFIVLYILYCLYSLFDFLLFSLQNYYFFSYWQSFGYVFFIFYLPAFYMLFIAVCQWWGCVRLNVPADVFVCVCCHFF